MPNMPKTAHALLLGLFDLQDTIWSKWIITMLHNSSNYLDEKEEPDEALQYTGF